MKKSVALLGGVMIIGGGLWLGSAWYTGTRLEAGSPEYVTRLNAELRRAAVGTHIKVSQLSFKRGLFDSQARYALTIEEEDVAVTLEFDTRYEHGPLPLSALSRGQFTPKMAIVRSDLVRTADVEQWFQAAQNASTPMWTEAVVSYDGNIDFEGGLAAVKHEKASGSKLDFDGASLQGAYTHANQHFTSTFRAPSLTASDSTSADQPLQLALDDVQMETNIRQGRFGIWTGEAELRAGRLNISSPDQPNLVFAIENLAYGGSGSEDDRFVQGEVFLRGEGLTINDVALGNPSLTLKLDQLDGVALKRLIDAADALVTEADGETPDAAKIETLFTQHVPALLDARPGLKLDPLAWQNAGGASTLNIHTRFAPPVTLRAPAVFMQAIKSVDIDLNLHKPMVIDLVSALVRLQSGMDADTARVVAQQQYDALAGRLTRSGFFVKQDGDHLVSKVQYDGGNVVVNGRDASLGELLGLAHLF